MYDGSNFVEVGGLASYSSNDADLFKRAAIFADKILKGTKRAGINRHGVADQRAAQERSSAPFWLRVMRLGPKGRG